MMEITKEEFRIRLTNASNEGLRYGKQSTERALLEMADVITHIVYTLNAIRDETKDNFGIK